MFVRKTLLSSAAALAVLSGAVAAQAQQASVPVVAVDERTRLSDGIMDAGQAAKGLALEHAVAPPPGFFDPAMIFAPPTTQEEGQALNARIQASPDTFSPLALSNTDMALSGNRLFVGNFNGFNAYDVSSGKPELILSVVCPGGQGDLSVHGDLLFMSVEENRGRVDCGASGAGGAVNAERFRGVRIFDISDLQNPRQVAAVQTCRGSHTHTLVPSSDPNVLYVYNSGTSGVRRAEELSICSSGEPGRNADTALYSIDVIKVPLDRPQDAAIVNRPRIFADENGRIDGLWTGGRIGVTSQETAQTNQCHDITVFPGINRAAGACAGNGIFLDISDPENPKRISDLFDPDMAYWHSATFDNTGDKIVFTDEWSGGIGARCQLEDPATWGANLIATVGGDGKLRGRAFHKLPSAQNASENCVAHNGNLIPVPGRDLMVQAWYQGGISVMDFSDPMKPVEIAYFDRGPLDADRLMVGGSWSAYWFNGRIYSSEIARGVDVLKLVPSDMLSPAEIAAAEAVRMDVINPQTQTRVEWADTPDVAMSYVDQLTRSGADAALMREARAVVDGWRAGSADAATADAVAARLTEAAGARGVSAVDARRMRALAGVFERIG
ncbi:LVIVD repeat-containing protein [Brevundimonas fluminis]|jgi:hypothetical protein|uniref:LVIVD repeat-containing protein n=1 Tax=Brevundimonas fluminis TaxID=2487274 RepID=UPI000F65749C|nr:hypothetical protein [Brevundimonas fluminis]